MNRALLTLLLCILGPRLVVAQPVPVFQDPDAPVAARVDDLLALMTPEEKFRQLFMIPAGADAELFAQDATPENRTRARDRYAAGLFGFQFSSQGAGRNAGEQMLANEPGRAAREAAEGINAAQRFFVEESRLSIPIIPFDEALHGLVRRGATAFPQAIGLAATFDTTLVGRVANAIADETRSRGIRQILSPVLNIARDPRWGRVEETYGEDPVLTSAMGVAFVGALERNGVVATPKHFVANYGEGGRDSYPISFGERELEEVYFPAFRAAVTRAGARSFMAAYNSVDGAPASASRWLLTEKLKNEWGFRGFVISDAGGTGGANVLHFTAADYTDATRRAVTAGLDVIFQTSYDHIPLFKAAFDEGLIDPAVIDSAVSRVLRAKFELGLFENPYVDPEEAARLNGSAEHRVLAREAARESMVLLKNDAQMLPLGPDVRSIAVIGRDAVDARLGGYSGPGNNVVSILNGLTRRAGSDVRVRYAEGVPRQESNVVTVPGEYLRRRDGDTGLDASYWDNIHLDGAPTLERVDRRIDFGWTLFGPDSSLPFDWYSVRWMGEIVAPETGTLRIGVEGNDGWRLWIGDSLRIDNWRKVSSGRKLGNLQVEAGQTYPLRLEYHETVGSARLRLVWDVGVSSDAERRIEGAQTLASNSDVAIVVAGIEEGEFRDRSSLALPGKQAEMIRAVAATGTPTVVVLVGGSTVTMTDWMEDVDSILLAWYPGEAGGMAVADILYGDVSPGGRLPITFPRDEGQLPLYYAHKPTGRGDDYADQTGRPLFPFGYGLSYSSFTYSDLEVEPVVPGRSDTVRVSFSIANIGQTAADEVAQLYLRDELSSVVQPIRRLVRFSRVHLVPGESTRVTFSLSPDDLSLLDANLNRVVEPGTYRLMVGASSVDIRLRGRF